LPPDARWGGPEILVTDRLSLRPFAHGDLAAYQAMCADPVVMEYLGGPSDAARTEEGMLQANARLAAEGHSMVAVERRADGRFLGSAGLSVEEWYPDDLQVGWRLAPEFWGHGYASEAARAWLGHGFSALGAERILAIADLPNDRSVAVMRRVGMRRSHEEVLTVDDETFAAVVYVLTAAEWHR
jgi:RimJ/RimL family protein N-acetyltransferase